MWRYSLQNRRAAGQGRILSLPNVSKSFRKSGGCAVECAIGATLVDQRPACPVQIFTHRGARLLPELRNPAVNV